MVGKVDFVVGQVDFGISTYLWVNISKISTSTPENRKKYFKKISDHAGFNVKL
jgi:hypothetical protein